MNFVALNKTSLREVDSESSGFLFRVYSRLVTQKMHLHPLYLSQHLKCVIFCRLPEAQPHSCICALLDNEPLGWGRDEIKAMFPLLSCWSDLNDLDTCIES